MAQKMNDAKLSAFLADVLETAKKHGVALETRRNDKGVAYDTCAVMREREEGKPLPPFEFNGANYTSVSFSLNLTGKNKPGKLDPVSEAAIKAAAAKGASAEKLAAMRESLSGLFGTK